ncbi:hypothetical protein HanIR_Chr08g0372851 [Helianthus annuus]|nr:hypothetical protein HanIR_Chr08g0372851 [Helianthus annuus]
MLLVVVAMVSDMLLPPFADFMIFLYRHVRCFSHQADRLISSRSNCMRVLNRMYYFKFIVVFFFFITTRHDLSRFSFLITLNVFMYMVDQ